MAYICTRNFNLVMGGKARPFSMGDSVNDRVFNSFPSTIKAYFISPKDARKSMSGKLNWSEDELNAVIDLYLELFDDVAKTCNDWAVAFRFAALPQFADRGIQGVRFIVGQIKAVDSLYAGVGCTSVSLQLQALLQERDSERFCYTEALTDIDALLAEIRG